MKLSTKFLTTLVPIAVAGTIIPTTISCSCSKNDYLFNYGDQVNCRDKDDGNYHEHDEVVKAAKMRTLKCERRTFDDESGINSYIHNLSQNDIRQFYFNDFIASMVIQAGENINLKDWKANQSESTPVWSFTFTLNGQQYPKTEAKASFAYTKNADDPNDKGIYLVYRTDVTDTNALTYRSYTFSDCSFK